MEIRALTLYTDELNKQLDFYRNTFRLPISDNTDSTFSVQIGHTSLRFQASEKSHTYHYCFLIPNNKLNAAIEWLQSRLEVITYEDGRVIEPGPEEWNAGSVYFLDPTGNILEFIVRHDLENDSEIDGFDATHIISVNEIGMASRHPEVLNEQLSTLLGSQLKYGDVNRFGANGSLHGLFLLVNYHKKNTWFPTQTFPEPAPFEGVFHNNGQDIALIYQNESLQALDK